MRVYEAGLLCSGLLACGPATADIQRRALMERLDNLQAQVRHLDAQVHDLSTDVALSTALRAHPAARATATVTPSSGLEVAVVAPTSSNVVAAEAEVVEVAHAPNSDDLSEDVTAKKWDAADGAASPSSTIAPPPRPSELLSGRNSAALFARALADYQRGAAERAYRLLATLVRVHPTDAQAHAARFWMGQCKFEQGDFSAAIREFKRFSADAPHTDKKSDALYKMGIAYERLRQPQKSRAAFTQLIARFPRSDLADLARRRVAAQPEMQP